MIRIQQVKLPLGHTAEQLEIAVQKACKLKKEEIASVKVVKKSLDARKKPQILAVYTLDVSLYSPQKEVKLIHDKRNSNIIISHEISYCFPIEGSVPLPYRPVIVGTGPAGLFCGLLLAQHGFQPILLERGQAVEERSRTVQAFWDTNRYNDNSNVQFGEGGAGTFSDGKLNTLVKDKSGRNKKVLDEFVNAGANEEILYVNKPHLGTDELQTIVKNIRLEIQKNGGEVRFESQVTKLIIEDGAIAGVELNGDEILRTNNVVLAIGHSARDTFDMLKQLGVPMQAKAFAVGIRMEHPQKMIDFSQYGMERADYLPAADYKLATKTKSGRGVYSFCMCPGGYVVNASSEPGRLVVNGMSYSNRNGENANSAIVVTVGTEDFPSKDVLAGVEFQRRLEEKAYLQGEGKIPIQLLDDFKSNHKSKSFGDYEPCMKGGYQFADVSAIFPESLNTALIEGILSFDKNINGFARKDAILSGVESRTSSPVRIMRGENLESDIRGLYPCGEGAGYAGGIMSAAIDGIKVAEAIVKREHILYSCNSPFNMAES